MDLPPPIQSTIQLPSLIAVFGRSFALGGRRLQQPFAGRSQVGSDREDGVYG